MASKYNLISTKPDENWDQFVNSSPNGTVFATSKYLSSLEANVRAYYCYKSQELMAAVLCLVSEDGNSIEGDGFVIYDGLIYKDMKYLNKSQRYSEEFAIQEYVGSTMIDIYNKVRFTFHPSIKDIRAMLWVNYHSMQNGYNADIRYTCQVNISDFSRDIDLDSIFAYRNASSARRQEIRYAIKKGVTSYRTDNIEQFIKLYLMTMGSQNIEIGQSLLVKIRQLLTNLIKQRLCYIFESRTRDGEVGSMAVFLLDFDKHTAYYLLGASNPNMKNKHTGTAVLWDAFYELRSQFKVIDLEGINSPNRGWFKTSFGAEIVPYLRVYKSSEKYV